MRQDQEEEYTCRVKGKENLCLAAQTWKKAYETFTDSVIHKIESLRLEKLLGTAEHYKETVIVVPNACFKMSTNLSCVASFSISLT